ncbi:MAG: family 43 glycosylhydrolase, partial [Planctomycetes bacterium]|nr:family 43 glycosylhydrolase [Planctomycetota bacterium]
APSSGGIYAPTIRYHNGCFFMVTTNMSGRGNFYVHSTDPSGEWSDPVWLKQGGIDPSLLFENDTVYLTSNGLNWQDKWGIYQSELDIRTGEFLTEPRFIWGGTGGRYPEAPHLYKIGDTYYLMIAEGGTEYTHMETIARSDSPWGPFEPCPHNPILSHRSRPSPIQATGHGDLVQDHNGNWWMVFLAVRPNKGLWHHLGRETFLAPVEWENGWPVVGEDGRVNIEMDSPLPANKPFPTSPERDDFNTSKLRPCWNFLRNPESECWSLSQHPGHLTLNGSAVSLDDTDSPAFVGRRQQHFDFRAMALVDFAPRDTGEETGVIAYMNERHHYDLGLIRSSDRKTVALTCRIGFLKKQIACKTAPDGPVELAVSADADTYCFTYAAEGGSHQELAAVPTRYLSKEVAGGFTGVFLGMYATGNGQPCNAPAHFDWFDYEPLQTE